VADTWIGVVMNDSQRLATLLDNLHEHAGHGVRLERCLQADCRELRDLLVYERVVWLANDEFPRRDMWSHQPFSGGLTVHGEVP
jgi:hypothetical protein